ncbi:MAG: DUF1064 domain-containing protein [Clostridiales bacterium]|nr:DUF1064 domain-containing protein [Clostridiales bacterium]
MSKYHSRKTTTEEGTFDSKKEYRRWQELKLLERGGAIHDLRRQVPFTLVPSQRGGDGKVVERPVKYVADFVYIKDGRTIVEDTKGVKTPDYIIKRKLMLLMHGIRIFET